VGDGAFLDDGTGLAAPPWTSLRPLARGTDDDGESISIGRDMTNTRESYAMLVERMLGAEAHVVGALRVALRDESKRWVEIGGNIFHVEIFRDADAVVVDDSLAHPGEGRAVMGIERFLALVASHEATGRVSDPGDTRFANRLGSLLGAIHALSLDADAQEARLRCRGTKPCPEELSLPLHDALSRVPTQGSHHLEANALDEARRLDAHLAGITGANLADLWTLEALHAREEWQQARALAVEALAPSFGHPAHTTMERWRAVAEEGVRFAMRPRSPRSSS